MTDAEEAALFARADIVVLPYERGDRFGFSGVLATALGAGKAIVLSDVGGLSEVGRPRRGRLVPAGDSAALRAALSELIADPDSGAALAAAARARRPSDVLLGGRGQGDARSLRDRSRAA